MKFRPEMLSQQEMLISWILGGFMLCLTAVEVGQKKKMEA